MPKKSLFISFNEGSFLSYLQYFYKYAIVYVIKIQSPRETRARELFARIFRIKISAICNFFIVVHIIVLPSITFKFRGDPSLSRNIQSPNLFVKQLGREEK